MGTGSLHFCSVFGGCTLSRLEESLSFAVEEQTLSLRVTGWSGCSARREDQGCDLCPVQKQGVHGDNGKRLLVFFLQLHSSDRLKGAKAFPVCCALNANKVVRLSGLS